MPENLSLKEIEENFPLSKSIIYRWIEKGKLDTKKEDGEVLIKLEDIKNLLDER